MSETLIKLQNIKQTPFYINYPNPDGTYRPYVFKGVKGNREDVLMLPEEIVLYLRYETTTFQDGFLILPNDENDSELIDEIKEVVGDIVTYTLEEMKEILKLTAKEFQNKVPKDTSPDIVKEFIRVANEMKIDSSAIKRYLAELIGQKDNVEVLFPSEED